MKMLTAEERTVGLLPDEHVLSEDERTIAASMIQCGRGRLDHAAWSVYFHPTDMFVKALRIDSLIRAGGVG